jgi:hypothetical protein
MNSFYITVISDISLDMNPGNSPNSFCNKLPKRFEIYEDYEVALTKITLPISLKNIYGNRSMAWINIGSSIYKRCVIKEEYCDDINKVLSQLENELGNKFSFTIQNDRVLIKSKVTEPVHCLRLSKILAKQLGFTKSDEFLCGSHHATNSYNLNAGIPEKLFFHTNIIKPQIHGDRFLQIIQSCVIELKKFKFGDYKEISFSHLQYFPLNVRDFDQIFFYINDRNGIPAPFDSGTCYATLHFRQVIN